MVVQVMYLSLDYQKVWEGLKELIKEGRHF